MTDLAEMLERALHAKGVGCPYTKLWDPEAHEHDWHDLHAAAILATPEGQALQAVMDAAVTLRKTGLAYVASHGDHPAEWLAWRASQDALDAAVDRWEELT